MSAKDKIVEDLLATVNQRKAEISKVERSNWVTNCLFVSPLNESYKLNLNVANAFEVKNALATLIGARRNFEEASLMLGDSTGFTHLGYSFEDWASDFLTRKGKIDLAAKKKELADLEARLNKLVSQERREELELAAIQAALSKG